MVIYSESGTNFVGAAHALERVDMKKIDSFSTSHRIDWKCMPPTAAWWGG